MGGKGYCLRHPDAERVADGRYSRCVECKRQRDRDSYWRKQRTLTGRAYTVQIMLTSWPVLVPADIPEDEAEDYVWRQLRPEALIGDDDADALVEYFEAERAEDYDEYQLADGDPSW